MVYRRMPPLKYIIAKTLFQGTLPVAPMAHPWEKYLYKPLIMANIFRYLNTMPKESHKWFPNFSGNNVITVDNNIYAMG